jgi:hypothetical protein
MAKLKTQIGNCTVDNCAELKYAHNLCKKHNSRRYRTGRTDLGPRVPWNKGPNEVCIIDGCNTKHLSKGFCQKHWKSFTAWIDKDRVSEDWQKYSPTKEKGYVKLYRPNHPNTTKYGMIMEHRLVMEEMVGRLLEKHETVHHKNGNRLDNRPENLELWSVRQPKGQRVEDKVEYAVEILKQYAPHLLEGRS